MELLIVTEDNFEKVWKTKEQSLGILRRRRPCYQEDLPLYVGQLLVRGTRVLRMSKMETPVKCSFTTVSWCGIPPFTAKWGNEGCDRVQEMTKHPPKKVGVIVTPSCGQDSLETLAGKGHRSI